MRRWRRFLAPEVVQTSGMDCGPASLKCLCEGFGIPVSYGRLREACQTGVDGTSIDTMEVVARQLGLDAEQLLLPIDHLLESASHALPGIVVVTLPSGLTHFVVVWRRHGGGLQVMDPATGRRWPSCARFLDEVYLHATAAPVDAWFEFGQSEGFQTALDSRLSALGIRRNQIEPATGWRALATLDAALRLCASLVDSNAIARGREASRLVEQLRAKLDLIPRRYWFAFPSEDGLEVMLSGAVVVRVRGRLQTAPEELPRELAAAKDEKPLNPVRELIRLLHAGGRPIPLVLVMTLAVAAAGVIAEAVLFRSLLDLGGELGLAGQRIGAIGALLLFSGALMLLEAPAFAAVLRLGRQVEIRLRVAFLAKIPRLGDRYFQSRLISDMAERSHTTHRLRHLPDIGRQVLRSVFELCATAAGIIWLAPGSAPLVLLAVAAAVLPPLLLQPVLAERDLRLRSHAAALTRYYLDAMLGLVAIRAHGAERAVRRQHENLLGKWAGAGFSLQRAVVSLEAFQLVTIFALATALILNCLTGTAGAGRILLLVYWVLNIPQLGQDIGALARQLPYYRNLTLRLLEPLGAPEEPIPRDLGESPRGPLSAPEIEFRSVRVEASGHTILDEVDLRIEPGAHVAVVGLSGAGKSSLVGVLLGWLRPCGGEVLIDGRPLDCESLRRDTAWVDPAVQLWNRTLLDNLSYGGHADLEALGDAIDGAALRDVLESLPEGLQTNLGESGALVSGGQGQRVRLGRALLQRDIRLAILDEPFRGLDRERRRDLLGRARRHWRDATLIAITHDVEETLAFDRVLVIEHGRILEDGEPKRLAASRQSRYAQLLEAETEVRTGLWSGPMWRRVRVESGKAAGESASQKKVAEWV